MQLNLPPQTQLIDSSEVANKFDEAINVSLKPKLDALIGKQILFRSDEKELSPLGGWESKNCIVNINRIKAIGETATVAAIDSSCAFIGETSEGSIYSAKCGLAIASMGVPVMHFKIGPILFYIDDETMSLPNTHEKLWKFVLFDTITAKRMIRIRIERVMQNEICRLLTNAIILVDGSLKRSVFEDEHNGLNRILKNCEVNGNQLVGISKTTRIKVLDKLASSLMRKNEACYIDVSSLVKNLVSNVLGKPLLAKLSNNGSVLRVDVLNNPNESLGRLVTNDAITNGYPETLAFAHHVSLFNRTDITCIKGFILSKFGVREMMGEDVRRTLLGAL
ncbi:MAG: DNA double-strand break repair nuclease NurA [Nitrososphaerales archaeon]